LAVRFVLFGTIAAFIDDRPVELGHARQRSVLAALLADANRPVSVDQLTERVWADRLPHRAHRSIASYLSRLRGALAGADDVDILRGAGGYLIRVDPKAVDLHRFRTLVARARERRSLELFDQALDLCQGEAFAGVDTRWCDAMRRTLDAERLAAELDRTDIALRLGAHNAVLAGVAARAAASPFDERMAGQLMLALYRAGRQADALDHYRRTRLRLADEFGADPGPALRELHQKILVADAELELSGELTVPRQLPAPPRWFVGRDSELAVLTEAMDTQGGTVTVSAIAGPGGIGKTSLALKWAHRGLTRFPDGQLHVDLRGFDPSGAPMPPAVAIRRFLDALGVAPAAIPADEDSQVALYRSLVAGKRLLVMLDNARDAGQVEPLLPGSETCTVLITSRNRLGGLGVRGARLLPLDVLADEDARELLTHHIGAQRIAEEPRAVAALVRWCAGLPLALSIVASRAATQPGFPLDVLAKELRDSSARLDALDAGDLNANLRAVFSWSYHALDRETAQVFRLLGPAPGPDIGLPAAAALTGLSGPRVRAMLRVLVDAHLLQEYVPGRYRMDDLLRLYATELAGGDELAGPRRLIDFYLHTSRAAAHLLRPARQPIELFPPAPGCTPLRLEHRAAAAVWFTDEHACLLAALDVAVRSDWHDAVWKLAWTLSAFHVMRGHVRDDLAAWRTAVTATRKLDEPVAQAVARMFLGDACTRVGDHTQAVDHLHRALFLAERAQAVTVLADVQHALGWTLEQRGDLEQALIHTEHALRLFRATGNAMREADALNSAGWLHARLGHHAQAVADCERALVLCRDHENHRGEVVTLDSLGFIAQRHGEHARALDYYRDALRLARETEDTYDEAGILDNMGEAQQALGRHGEAREAWQRALELYQAQHRAHGVEAIRRKLDAAPSS
jgi:DNA-binding SARP family transcriptional activator/tetratricopeptide (TPR) repeat protein